MRFIPGDYFPRESTMAVLRVDGSTIASLMVPCKGAEFAEVVGPCAGGKSQSAIT